METVIYLSLATASISFTVTEAKIFNPFREWLKSRSRFWGELFSCGYCLGHWLAFALTAVYRPRLFDFWRPLDYLLTALVMAWLAGLQWALMCLMMDRAGK